MFGTQDLGLIAALQLHGVTPAETRFDKRRLVCHYEDTPDLRHVREAYYGGRLHGPLNVFNGLVRALTVQIKEGVQHGR
jgi:hypothetical protein